jgi:uncharacterized damage-inducible protein DinB
MTERDDLVQTLDRHRGFLLHTLRGLPDEQARLRPTASAMSLGALVKHVAATEAQWADFATRGAQAFAGAQEQWSENWTMHAEETLEGLLQRYAEVAAHTTELVRTLDLDAEHPLPPAPWFEPGAAWSGRRVFLHVLAETAQHAGHADILRESIDGQKTMG